MRMTKTVSAGAVAGLCLAGPAAAPLQDPIDHGTTTTEQVRAPRALPSGQALLDLVNRVKPAVVMVVMTNEAGGEVASSTGVMLEGGLVLAPRDVVAKGAAGRIALSNDQVLVIDAVAAEDEASGLAILSFVMPPHLDQSVIETAPLSTDEGVDGDAILAVSSPLGRQNYAATPGELVVSPESDTERMLDFNLNLPARSNGSPVIDTEGEVVGVAVEKADKSYEIQPAHVIIDLAVEAAESERVPLATFHEEHAPAAASNREVEGAANVEATIVKRPDGSTLVDDEFIMRGSGTDDDPYRITWDQLISAARFFEPRAGRNDLPQRITMLDGKWVELSGYLAFPLGSEESDEMLLMLNQWDGCCIGVPPTPYDAIEVTLVAPFRGEGGVNIFNYGSVRGLFDVDPYVANGWLIGLYLMNDATIALDD